MKGNIMNSNTLIGAWLVLYGALSLVQTKVPDWIVPVAAGIVGLISLAGSDLWKRDKGS